MTKEQIIKSIDALQKHLKKDVSIGSIEATRPKDSSVISIDFEFFNYNKSRKKDEIDSLQLRTVDYETFEVWSYEDDKKARLGFSQRKIAAVIK